MHAIRKTLIVTALAAMALATAATTCYTTITGTSRFYPATGSGTGFYRFDSGTGSYRVDAQDSPLLRGHAGPVVIPGANGNPPMVTWGQAYPFSVDGLCPNGTANFTVNQNGAVIASGPMTETPVGSGTYSGTIPPLQPGNQGDAQVTVTVACPNGSTQNVSFNIVINGPAPAPCSAAYSVPSSWSGGFQGQVVVTDTGNSPVNGWTLTWTFPGNQQITSLWNGTYTQSGKSVTVTSAPYDGTIQPGGSVSVGFNANYSGTNTAPSSVTCT
jgi:cellulase/cellobiase CelA1